MDRSIRIHTRYVKIMGFSLCRTPYMNQKRDVTRYALQEITEPGNERGSIARMWVAGSFPSLSRDDEPCARKDQVLGCSFLPGCQEAPRMIEVKVGEDDDIDLLGTNSKAP